MAVITKDYLLISKDQLAQVLAEGYRRIIANPSGYASLTDVAAAGDDAIVNAGKAEVVELLGIVIELFPGSESRFGMRLIADSHEGIDKYSFNPPANLLKSGDGSLGVTGSGGSITAPDGPVQAYNAGGIHEPGPARSLENEGIDERL